MAAVNGMTSMTNPTLHYIFDPLCGWCYAAAPLIAAAGQLPGVTIALHGGGMMTGERRKHITPDWRGYVLPHDRRIEQMTGQVFGPGYTEGLLNDTTALLDSAPHHSHPGCRASGRTRPRHAATPAEGALRGRPAHR